VASRMWTLSRFARCCAKTPPPPPRCALWKGYFVPDNLTAWSCPPTVVIVVAIVVGQDDSLILSRMSALLPETHTLSLVFRDITALYNAGEDDRRYLLNLRTVLPKVGDVDMY
jgi:hypothetical protein